MYAIRSYYDRDRRHPFCKPQTESGPWYGSLPRSESDDQAFVITSYSIHYTKLYDEVDTPAGKIKAMLPPGMPESFEPRMDPVPAIGEHTDAILAELGYGDDQIARLHEARVV